MAQDNATSVEGVAVRISRLTDSGTVATGPNASYVTKAFTSLDFTPEYDAGAEFTEKTASGTLCVSYKQNDTLKRININLAICEPDPELTELATGGTILTRSTTVNGTTTTQSVGYAAPFVGTDPTPNGIAIEVWSLAIQNGKKAPNNPYFRWVFPYVQLSNNGQRQFTNGVLATTFTGIGQGNASFGTGPAKDWPFISDRPYQYARTNDAPVTVAPGYVTVS